MTDTIVNDKKMTKEQFDFLSRYLSEKYGLRVPPEKKMLLESRLLSRLNALKMESISEYIDLVFKSGANSNEYHLFVDQITTHKTFFFRENYQFDFLNKVMSGYLANKGNHPLQFWSAGCSTGEEVFTLGMILNEKKKEIPSLDYKIVGTDVSIPSLKRAAKGSFSTQEIENIPDQLKDKYFVAGQSKYGATLQFINKEIISKISLGVLNLNNKFYNLPNDFDFIFCRNVIIYFDAKTRNEVLERIVDKLRPGGYLFLGHSETALGTTLPLKSIQPTIYQKI